MANIKTSKMFGTMQKSDKMDKDRSSVVNKITNDQDSFFDLEELLDELSVNGDYQMLPLVINFMKNMTPFDLFSFFDTFSAIERGIFKKYDIDYSNIRAVYEKYRPVLQKDYVNFIISYYKESNSIMFSGDEEYTQEQLDFLSERFSSVQCLLIEIGKRLSRDYYTDIIVDD